jgi:fatty acid synthase
LFSAVTLGFSTPSKDGLSELMHEVYNECGVKPSQVVYVEASGNGMKVGDSEEANSLADLFCTPDREAPLLVGSVKSNMGSSDASEGK